MISSVMPVFIARVALCSTWLAGAKRFSKNSSSVGLSDIFASAGILRLSGGPFGPNRLPAPRRMVASRRRRGDLRLAVEDQPAGILVQLLHHVVLERLGLRLGIERSTTANPPTLARNARRSMSIAVSSFVKRKPGFEPADASRKPGGRCWSVARQLPWVAVCQLCMVI